MIMSQVPLNPNRSGTQTENKSTLIILSLLLEEYEKNEKIGVLNFGITAPHMIVLKRFHQAAVINALELSIAESLCRLYQDTHPYVALGIALAQASLRLGHLAFRVLHVDSDFSADVVKAQYERQNLQLPNFVPIEPHEFPPVNDWLKALRKSPILWNTQDTFAKKPMILADHHLFTYKAWKGEAQVAHQLLLLHHLSKHIRLPQPQKLFQRLFAEIGTAENPGEAWFEGGKQWTRPRLALHTALHEIVTIIHGGPGTGKTTLTQRVLAALIEQYHQEYQPLRIALAAPTGKAAQRLTESIRSRAPFFHLPEEIQAVLATLQGETIHSLLKINPNRELPEYHAQNPLPYDVIVVDEASMIDTWLMHALLNAIDLQDTQDQSIQRKRLLLIGDPHQLPSVSAGAPFTEICAQRGQAITPNRLMELKEFLRDHSQVTLDESLAPSSTNHFMKDFISNQTSTHTDNGEKIDQELLQHAQALQLKLAPSDASPLLDHVIALNQVKRVSAQSGIHQVATLIQKVDLFGTQKVLNSLKNPMYRDTSFHPAPPFPFPLFNRIMEHYLNLVRTAYKDPRKSLDLFKELCLLSPHYGGVMGVHALNHSIEEALREEKVGGWGKSYVGRPILITQNHSPTALVNGDIGIMGSNAQVYFEQHEQSIAYDLLPAHRTVYAMSVHKSQGSEFQTVIFCLPPKISPIVTRELVYTGITRAKKEVMIVGPAEVLAQAITAKVERGGYLSKHLQNQNEQGAQAHLKTILDASAPF
jgi:exodeoxyribonuclease V alpha subunit